MDHLQNDIDSLETERISLRDKLKNFNSKKGDLKHSTSFGKQRRFSSGIYENSNNNKKQRLIHPFSNFIADISASSPYIAQEINLLKKAFTDERAERMKMQSAEMARVLNALKPIHVPKTKDNRILELEKDLIKVKHVRIIDLFNIKLIQTIIVCPLNFQDYIMSLAKGSEFPLAHTRTANLSKLLNNHQNKQIQLREEIKVIFPILVFLYPIPIPIF